jgi:hypothetical protein
MTGPGDSAFTAIAASANTGQSTPSARDARLTSIHRLSGEVGPVSTWCGMSVLLGHYVSTWNSPAAPYRAQVRVSAFPAGIMRPAAGSIQTTTVFRGRGRDRDRSMRSRSSLHGRPPRQVPFCMCSASTSPRAHGDPERGRAIVVALRRPTSGGRLNAACVISSTGTAIPAGRMISRHSCAIRRRWRGGRHRIQVLRTARRPPGVDGRGQRGDRL